MEHEPARESSKALTGREWLLALLILLALATGLGARLGGSLSVPTALLFLVCAPAGMALFFLTRKRALPAPSRVRGSARILAGILIVGSWIPVAGLTGLLFLLSEPWPLSLRHGPDTEYARDVFERYTGFPPPASVHELFARNQWEGPGEHVTSIRFRSDDPAVLARIVARLRLVPVPAAEVRALASFPGPSFWPEKDQLAAATEAYRGAQGSDPQCYVHLWIDRAGGMVYLQDVDVA